MTRPGPTRPAKQPKPQRRYDPPPNVVGWRRTWAKVGPWLLFLGLLGAFTTVMVLIALRFAGG